MLLNVMPSWPSMQISDWPALHKWSSKYLKKAFKGRHILAGDYPMSFSSFLAYSRHSHDEMPLYLFDKHFAHKAPQLATDYKASLSMAFLPGRHDRCSGLVLQSSEQSH